MEGTGFSPYIQNTNKNRTFVYATKSRKIFETRESTEGGAGFNPRTTAIEKTWGFSPCRDARNRLPSPDAPPVNVEQPSHLDGRLPLSQQSQTPHPPPFEFFRAAFGSHRSMVGV
jgi:hypothetical protein